MASAKMYVILLRASGRNVTKCFPILHFGPQLSFGLDVNRTFRDAGDGNNLIKNNNNKKVGRVLMQRQISLRLS